MEESRGVGVRPFRAGRDRDLTLLSGSAAHDQRGRNRAGQVHSVAALCDRQSGLAFALPRRDLASAEELGNWKGTFSHGNAIAWKRAQQPRVLHPKVATRISGFCASLQSTDS